ncbi:unnamed protein product (macronuclear) [Paramecium tetraurelia]|uniref:Uncharacterized protein n=1 Tax=Paramecium tetraurelia TaxID=5888 RepID=A0BJ01_PARTE|nr:uncharacterized protein GSPATT00004891001 [Paramecium tetraurelia]CAK58518.1 unnamed protein product [Paramecium tetraurelia]|eukprot:XP_001425916.1 hypothetical protein (macronuclear) [Paramecium tetraurelia strain d4-2]
MNSNFLKQIEEENRILEQELQNLLNQKRQRVEKELEDPDEDNNPNFRSEKGDLSKIDEETDEEQPNRIEPHRLMESPQKPESVIDNIQDSINNYLEKNSSSIVDIQSNRQSQKNVDQKNKQINSLEMRLLGTREALKCLEKEVKDKNVIIQNLEIDLAKKQKQIDSLQKTTHKSNTPPNKEVYNEGFQEIKKQCKEWERRYIECNSQLKENQKYASKLQELNQQLLYKLKQFESDKEFSKTELDQQKNINNEMSETNTNILIKYEQIIKLKDKYILLEDKYDELKQNSEQFLLSSRDLKYQYEHMLNTLQSIANSY